MKRVVHTVYHTPNRTPTCEPIYVTVGYNIKAWREHLGFTQAELAEEVGIQRTSINNAEAGRQRLMLHTIQKIAEALDVPLCDLFSVFAVKSAVNMEQTVNETSESKERGRAC